MICKTRKGNRVGDYERALKKDNAFVERTEGEMEGGGAGRRKNALAERTEGEAER